MSNINDLAGERGALDVDQMPRVSLEPLEPARVSGARGGLVGAEIVRATLHYDPETGHFTRIGDARKGRGGLAGTINNNGYRLIRVGEHRHRAHRLAWLYVTGQWPLGEIDHINGVRDDNRIANLRDVPMLVNQQNRRKALKGSQTGYLGVSPCNGKFRAAIWANGRDKHLGTFDTPAKAHAAYLEAKRELHAGCTL